MWPVVAVLLSAAGLIKVGEWLTLLISFLERRTVAWLERREERALREVESGFYEEDAVPRTVREDDR